MSKLLNHIAIFLIPWLVISSARGQVSSSVSPIKSAAKFQYAPDRDYDLRHISFNLNIDAAKRSFNGVSINVLAPLRQGLTAVRLNCGENLTVTSCEIDRKPVAFHHEGDRLTILSPNPLKLGKSVSAIVHYYDKSENDLPSFHWLKPSIAVPQRIGFWTKGEPNLNRQWLPTWDYPNDFATTEARVTVPSDWYVISNGVLISDALNPSDQTRTFHWKMDQPYATYLISLVGGRMDMKTSKWRGIQLIYAVPKGDGNRINDTFGDTPDMLSFFSDILGVKYPWRKYAQTVAYDFPGGMENASATTLEEGNLADDRSGYKTSDHGISHELAHQWFGDLVTCDNWGDLWLNEGFACFFADLYQEHARGEIAYDHAIIDAMQSYITKSQQYKRPLSIRSYENPDSNFDFHSYDKGEIILHTLRRKLGDKPFFAGLHHYLIKYRHQPVDSRDLCRAMTEATGINLESFFDQWVFKPGHPILDYDWRWDETGKQVVLTVKQTQNVSDGTPIYNLNATVGLIDDNGVTRMKTKIDQAEQVVFIRSLKKPKAVLFDPDHDFLREIPALRWSAEELPYILKEAPNPADREEAMNRMLAGEPSDAMAHLAVEVLLLDNGRFPVFQDIKRLGELKREDLRPFFQNQMNHLDYGRREQAILALGQLSKNEMETKALRDFVNDKEPYSIVKAAIWVLGNWDAPANRQIFQKAMKLSSPEDTIRLSALDELVKADAMEGIAFSDPFPQMTRTIMRFLSDRAMNVTDSPVMTARQRRLTSKGAKINAMISAWLKDLQSFVPLACDDSEAQELDAERETITRKCVYKMVTGKQIIYFKFLLTKEGVVSSVDDINLQP